MPGQLTLLDSVVAEGATESRHKVLVAVISIIERLHIRVGRIDILARERVARTVRIMVRSEMATACAEIAAALAEFGRDLSVVIRSSENRPPAPNAASARAAIDALNARIIKVRPQYIRVAGGAEIANFAAFGENLQAMLRLLERPIDVTSATEPMPPPIAAPSDSVAPALLRYCLKVGLCVVVGYIVGLTTQRADLSTILTTIIITALPTYGASLRKTILRMVGALLGGVLSLLMIIIVSPNFTTLPTYMFATFAVLFISAYSGMSSGRVAYAGNQIGTTYFLVVVGLSPPLDIYSPLWRVWGILLGTIVVTVVFFIIWPEYAGDSLLPRLRRVLTDTLALMPGGSSTSTVGAIDATSNEITQILSEILQVAEDARLEGRKSLIDHDSVVSSMGTIRRIASRIASFARLSISEVLPRLDDATEAAKDAVFLAMRRRMEAWIAFYGGTRLTSAAALALAGRHSRSEIAKPLEEFATRIEADGFARIAGWTLDQRRHTMGALESFRRIEFLMFELDAYLSHVLGGGPAIVFSDTEDGATPPSA